MDPVASVYSIASRFLANQISVTEFERAFVPFVPYLLERRELGLASELARAIDEILVDLGMGEASEDDLRKLVATLPSEAPTVLYVGKPRMEAWSESPTYHRAASFITPTDPIIRVGAPERPAAGTSART